MKVKEDKIYKLKKWTSANKDKHRSERHNKREA